MPRTGLCGHEADLAHRLQCVFYLFISAGISRFFSRSISPCADLVPLSCACAETHWSNKHCTCRRAPNPETGYCECFPVEKYEPLFQKCHEVVKTHHNQAATLSSNKNASKAVRDKVKAQQAAAAIIDASRQQGKQFTQKNNGTIS